MRNTYRSGNTSAAGTIDGIRFEYYVEHKLVPLLGNFALKQPRSIVMMDNAPTHIMAPSRVRNLIESTGALLIFLPRNSPDLNPIEYCFHIYKAALKRSALKADITSVEMAHYYSMLAVIPEKVRNEYRHLGVIQNIPIDEKEEDTTKKEDDQLVAAVIETLNYLRYL